MCYFFVEHFDIADKTTIVRHKCNDRLCIKPDCLQIGTFTDNILDMHSAQRGIRLGIELLHCQRGHDLTKPYAIRVVKRKGRKDSRTCRECEAIRRDPYRKNRPLTNVEQSDTIEGEDAA